MAILSGNYEPVIDTITIGKRYSVTFDGPDKVFAEKIMNIEFLVDRHPDWKELSRIIRGVYPGAIITPHGHKLIVRKHHLLHRRDDTIVTILAEGAMFAPYIMAETNHPAIGNYRNLLASGMYGNIEHRF